MKFRLVLPDPAVHAHARAFDEIALTVFGGLSRAGHAVEATRRCVQGEARVVVLAPHLQPVRALAALDADAILYNWEQACDGESPAISSALAAQMDARCLWDYSDANVEAWRARGVAATHVPLAYDPALESMTPPVAEAAVDAVFYGSLTARRRPILQHLADRGIALKVLFGTYGAARDHWIRRGRVVLNIHSYDAQILEVPRLAYLWANRVPVLSELDGRSRGTASPAVSAMLTAPRAELADRLTQATARPGVLREAAEETYRRFASAPHMSDVLTAALERA